MLGRFYPAELPWCTLPGAVWGHSREWSKSLVTSWAVQPLKLVCKCRSVWIRWSLGFDPRPRSHLTRDHSRPHWFGCMVSANSYFQEAWSGIQIPKHRHRAPYQTSQDSPMVLGCTAGDRRETWSLWEWQLEAKRDMPGHLRWHQGL